jgi:hypothetical protein
MTIDTLEYVKRLGAVGVDRKQAEAHAAAVRDTLAPQLATKVDIERLKDATKADLDTAVVRLEAKIEALRSHFEMALWKHTAGIIVTVIAVAGVLLRFLR